MAHHAEILALVDAVVTGDEVRRGKPAPDIFVEAARRLGCAPRRCVVFEDAPAGVQGAHGAGCACVALPDRRMPANASRLAALRPAWTLAGGIGDFPVDEIVRVPRSQSIRFV